MNFYASAQRNLTYFGLLLGLITICVIGEEIGQQSQGQAQVKGITQGAQKEIANLRADRAVKDEQSKLGVPAFKELVITDFTWGVSPPFGINQIQRFLPKNQHVILRDANGLCFGSVSEKGALTTIEDSSTACNTHIKPNSKP
jgi:hypothetical protein